DQNSFMRYSGQYQNLKVGMDFYANKKTTAGVVFSGFVNPSRHPGVNKTLLKNADNITDSIVVANNSDKGK
ncbi:MAG TPA: hypothetical protein VLM16_07960, partial [Ginsengibacter sp.]|nr:hypothetical protein [Ginsengibacter sp.]